MNYVHSFLVAGWFGLLALVAHAEIPTARIDQYMALSGIDEMIESSPRQIEVMVNQLLMTSENPDMERELMRVMMGAWDHVAIRASVQDYIREASSATEIENLLSWKISPLAKKMLAAEMDSYSPSFQEDFRRYAGEFRVNPPDEEATRAISRLVAEADVADIMVESTVQATRSMAFALVKTGTENRGEALAGLSGEWEKMRKALKPQMEQQAVLMAHYIYRDVAIEDINEYSTFYESSLGKREIALFYGSLETAMSQWAVASSKALVAKRQSVN